MGKVLYELSTGNDRREYPALSEHLGNRREMQDLMVLNKIIFKACRVKTWHRYQTAEEMMQALLSFQFARHNIRRQKNTRLMTRWLGVFGLLIALGVCLAVIWRIIYLLKIE